MVTEPDESISNKTVERLAAMIMKARHLVEFTGAGISTESGLADFRGPDALSSVALWSLYQSADWRVVRTVILVCEQAGSTNTQAHPRGCKFKKESSIMK